MLFILIFIAIFVLSFVLAARSMKDFRLPREVAKFIERSRIGGSIVFFGGRASHIRRSRKN